MTDTLGLPIPPRAAGRAGRLRRAAPAGSPVGRSPQVQAAGKTPEMGQPRPAPAQNRGSRSQNQDRRWPPDSRYVFSKGRERRKTLGTSPSLPGSIGSWPWPARLGVRTSTNVVLTCARQTKKLTCARQRPLTCARQSNGNH